MKTNSISENSFSLNITNIHKTYFLNLNKPCEINKKQNSNKHGIRVREQIIGILRLEMMIHDYEKYCKGHS